MLIGQGVSGQHMSHGPVCPPCGSESWRHSIVVAECMYGTGEWFQYRVCSNCGSLCLADRPNRSRGDYDAAYYSIAKDPSVLFSAPYAQIISTLGRVALEGPEVLLNVLDFLTAHKGLRGMFPVYRALRAARVRRRASAILDVGCGSGMVIVALSIAGLPSPTGIDPHTPSARVFRNGTRIAKCELADASGKFDIVMFHHSLEHIEAPVAALSAARRLLSKQGIIIVRVPTCSSAAYEKYGPKWVQLEAPRHMFVPSREGMKLAANRAGLKVAKAYDDSTEFQFWGSEQNLQGIPLASPRSYATNPVMSPFTRRQIIRWRIEAEHLNAAERGDQSAWILVRADEAEELPAAAASHAPRI